MRNLASLMIAALAVATLGVQTASAHTHLKSSNPAEGAKLTAAPKEITLTFEDEVQLTAVSVSGADGKAKALTPLPAQATKEATVALPALAAGNYTVNWRAAGHDGHVMTGHVKFSVAAPAAK